ncbi:MAG: DUF502 domain-containing protein [Verrucomicrobiota bacterium]|nr:DUF502 domain-containing protein [Verrucomicrobiota bacterium]
MKKIFFAGLVTLLPLTITLWILSILMNLLTRPFLGIVTSLFASSPTIAAHVSAETLHWISQIAILIAFFFAIILLGLTARFFFLQALLRLGDRILHRIPLINKIYKTAKEIVHSLFAEEKKTFQQVVLLPFPYPGSFAVGLVASDTAVTGSSEGGAADLVPVFVPTAPNPTSGFLVMCKTGDLIPLSMESEAAFKYVVSCALIQPGEVHPK